MPTGTGLPITTPCALPVTDVLVWLAWHAPADDIMRSPYHLHRAKGFGVIRTIQ